jgi:hypothetical protein
LATGQARVGEAFNNLWAEIEKKREEQRRRAAERRASGEDGLDETKTANGRAYSKAPDLTQAQAAVSAAGQRAGAYLSSWGSWASEKRKTGWGRTPSGTDKDSNLKRFSLVDKVQNDKDRDAAASIAPSTYPAEKRERPRSSEKRLSVEKRISLVVRPPSQGNAETKATTSTTIPHPVTDAKGSVLVSHPVVERKENTVTSEVMFDAKDETPGTK